jgi:hypothetical protein
MAVHPYMPAHVIFASNLEAEICGWIDPDTGEMCGTGSQFPGRHRE